MGNRLDTIRPAGILELWDRYVRPRAALFGQMGWIGSTYFLQQAIRLGSSIVLAWLLAPELLGTMLLINTLRTGGELLTDVGIGQSIVNNKNGAKTEFYNTAWTIQIIRGVILFAITVALAGPIAGAYDNPELLVLLPAVAPIFLLTGFTAPARFLLQKGLQVRKLAMFDLGIAILATLVQIGLAWVMPNIWALIWGLLIGTALSAMGSYLLMDWRSLRPAWNGDAARAVLHFGKWVFAASIIYFLAMNFDRLYFADAIPFAMLGIYGIARTFSDTIMQLFQRVGHLLIFPKISASADRGGDLVQSVGGLRRAALVVVAFGLAAGVALADQFIYLAYDDRYRAAGFFLPVLLIGTWFGILATMADAMMMGVGKPSGVAFSNGAKLAIIVIALPFVLPRYGLNAALAVFVAAEAVRYLVLALQNRLLGMGFTRQDIALTALFGGFIVMFRELTMMLGLTGGVDEWVALAQVSHV
ncbi:MAG: oligosaccharide flippase family protein [Pontixanthobacter sp.]